MTCECGCGHETSIARHNRSKLGYVAGQPLKYKRGHNRHSSRARSDVYPYYDGTGVVTPRLPTHRARAERALGKPLPPGAQVHHVGGTKNGDARLVICENQAYHRLLHRRENVIKAGGNPDTESLCWCCKKTLLFMHFMRQKTAHSRHPAGSLLANCRECYNAKQRERLHRKKNRG